MPKHEHFEELCSLAVLGELSASELIELTLHLDECGTCQASYLGFSELAIDHIPLAYRHSRRSPAPSVDRIRKAALDRIVAEGLRISPGAFDAPAGFRRRAAAWFDCLRWGIRAWRVQVGFAVALVVLLLVGGLAVQHDRARKHEIETLRAHLGEAQGGAAELRAQLTEVAQTQSRNTQGTEHLEQELADASARAERRETEHEQDVAAIRSLAAKVGGLSFDKNALTERVGSSDAELANLRSQLQQLRAAANEEEAQLVAARYQVAELSSQLKVDEAAVAHETQLLAAGRDIRDLMGARNLHIIDVHDLDARGESRPFGRIFLTEGKRLIFYAYDLDSVRVKNAAFQAWGQSNGDTRTAVSLGILYLDDQKQSRWTLKVEDPDLLKALDSVFVTVEPHGGNGKPTGKKLMYASLRNPINHP
jgi:hypothetical protein